MARCVPGTETPGRRCRSRARSRKVRGSPWAATPAWWPRTLARRGRRPSWGRHTRACVTHREESWLTAGRFESAIGAGETPGAEEWVVTPFGVVRYMAAKVAVEVRARDASVAVGSGPVFLWLR